MSEGDDASFGNGKPAEDTVDEDEAEEGHVIDGGRLSFDSRRGVANVTPFRILDPTVL